MNRFLLDLRLSAFICGSLFCSSISAAPPTVTSLFPAGAQRGTTTEIAAAGTFDAWPVKVWVSGKGVSVEAAKEKGRLKVAVDKDAVPGVYWLRAANADGASALRPFIVGTLPEVTEKEPNDDFKKPQVLDSSAVTVNGKLTKDGDVDCFAVNLKKGQTLVASVEANHALHSPMDAMLQVLTADGFVADENNDFHGLDPQIAFTAKKDGTHIVRVYAFPSQPDASIRYFGSDACVYRLTLTTGAFGLGSNVSKCVGPPSIQTRMQDFAFAVGALTVSAASPRARSAVTSPPPSSVPSPSCRQSRRETPAQLV